MKNLIFLSFLALYTNSLSGQELPIGYISYYENPCNSKNFLEGMVIPEDQSWKINDSKSYTILTPLESDSVTGSLPQNRGIIKNLVLGDYILEFEFKTLKPVPDDSSGFYFLSPVKSCDSYYAMGFSKDSLIFYYVYKGKPVKLQSQKLNVDTQQWTKVRVERDVLKRSILITLGNPAKEKHYFSDRRLVMGYVGFGTQTVNSALRNIRIWAPTAISDQILECE